MCTDVKSVRHKGFRWTLLTATAMVISACTANAGTPVPEAEVAPITAPVPAANPLDLPKPQTLGDNLSVPPTMAAEFARLQSEMPGSMGLAVMPVGGDHAITLGDWGSGIAWSTIKVPLALAALRHDPEGLSATAEAAITASDNDAAQQLWDALGGGDPAAEAVEAVLREAGDTTTDVADRHNPQARETVDDPLAFGATVWTLADQVRFASRLPCLPYAARVVRLMGEITASQSWGLGAFVGAEYKGGWGPDDETGAYLVRQFGVVPTFAGPLAVAVAAQPDSGSFDDATAMLDKMAALLSEHLHELGGGECRR
ncbi:serine hydrolase [Nocardia sp. BMG51109]|uniref:serine hydrolase n=1 Tax=Nocardia sp. BMG51109 TaxID=1056816 RepID=UPI0005602D90|nr:serine hydrolase [Nocardia sp. BMG51109]